jgi:hypothetical protein
VDWLELSFQFLVLHAILDFMLQPNIMAPAKSRHSYYHKDGNRDSRLVLLVDGTLVGARWRGLRGELNE